MLLTFKVKKDIQKHLKLVKDIPNNIMFSSHQRRLFDDHITQELLTFGQ